MLWTFSTCISIPTRYVDLYHFVSVCPLHTHAYSDINVLLRTYNNRNSWCLIYLYFIGDLSGLKIKYETCVSWTTHNAGFQSLLNSILDVGTSRLERSKKNTENFDWVSLTAADIPQTSLKVTPVTEPILTQTNVRRARRTLSNWVPLGTLWVRNPNFGTNI